MTSTLIRAMRYVSSTVLLVSVAWYVVASLNWPLVGDASLMHYIVFMADHGFVPYREITDNQFPGAYAPDWAVMHLLGGGALPWRMYDLGLLALAAIAIWRLRRRAGLYAGVWAAGMFAMVHGRDGLDQVGQRDLTVAVLLLGVAALLMSALPERRSLIVLLSGLLLGAAATIKPTSLLFFALPLTLLWWRRRCGEAYWPEALWIGTGFTMAPLLGVLWLLRMGAWSAFVQMARVTMPFYTTIARRPLGYLLQHSVSPVLEVVILWGVLSAIPLLFRSGEFRTSERSEPSGIEHFERWILLVGAVCGLLAYVMQWKGFPYHRYSLLAFLLPLMALDLHGMTTARTWVRWPAALLLLGSAIGIGLVSAVKISHYAWRDGSGRDGGAPAAIGRDLEALQRGLGTSLSGQVQCVDTVAGCLNALYDKRLLQSTGELYDHFVLRQGDSPAIGEARVHFAAAIVSHAPLCLVVTAPLFPAGSGDYSKLASWPEFSRWIDAHYTMILSRDAGAPLHRGGPAVRPAGYRIYLRNDAAAGRTLAKPD